MDYLMFCQKCGTPKAIKAHIMREYVWIAPHIYCSNCHYPNPIPKYIQSLARGMRELNDSN